MILIYFVETAITADNTDKKRVRLIEVGGKAEVGGTGDGEAVTSGVQ